MNLLKYKDQWEKLGDPVATSIMTEGFKLAFKSMPELFSTSSIINSVPKDNRKFKGIYILPERIKYERKKGRETGKFEL